MMRVPSYFKGFLERNKLTNKHSLPNSATMDTDDDSEAEIGPGGPPPRAGFQPPKQSRSMAILDRAEKDKDLKKRAVRLAPIQLRHVKESAPTPSVVNNQERMLRTTFAGGRLSGNVGQESSTQPVVPAGGRDVLDLNKTARHGFQQKNGDSGYLHDPATTTQNPSRRTSMARTMTERDFNAFRQSSHAPARPAPSCASNNASSTGNIDVRDKMDATKERMAESEVWRLASSIASALQYLNHLGIVHRDVKPENILWCQSAKPEFHPIRGGEVPRFGGCAGATTTTSGPARARAAESRRLGGMVDDHDDDEGYDFGTSGMDPHSSHRAASFSSLAEYREYMQQKQGGNPVDRTAMYSGVGSGFMAFPDAANNSHSLFSTNPDDHCSRSPPFGSSFGNIANHSANLAAPPQGVFKLADFGSAFILSPEKQAQRTHAHQLGYNNKDHSRLNKNRIHVFNEARQSVGTLSTMSPELLAGRPHDSSCDVWSLGVCLYECCQLEKPFLPWELQAYQMCGEGCTGVGEMRLQLPGCVYKVDSCRTSQQNGGPFAGAAKMSQPLQSHLADVSRREQTNTNSTTTNANCSNPNSAIAAAVRQSHKTVAIPSKGESRPRGEAQKPKRMWLRFVYSNKMRNLLTDCLEVKPSARPIAEDLVKEHPMLLATCENRDLMTAQWTAGKVFQETS
eukprot:g2810.t1